MNNMFSFAYPELLFLLLLIPLFVILYAWARFARKKKLKKFGRPEVIASLMPEVSSYKPPLKITVQMLALAMIVIAFARPWGGVKDEKTVKEGIEVVIAVDASNSMLASASDSPDGPDRMRTAKLILEKLINRLDNDRVGLIVYAGDAYTLIPVTNDYVSAKMFLNSISPSEVANQGTNISAAIDMATNSFSENKNIGKAIILITDAEELENQEAVMQSVNTAVKSGIQVDVVGVGSNTPVPIPMNGSYMIDDQTNEPVQTALNEDMAGSIAKEGRGIYVNASSRDALGDLDRQLSTLKKAAMQSSLYSQHDELFPIFVWLALALIVADIFLLERKISWLDKITFFKKEVK
ncbi:MAG: VWA domain-containing protein [Candidatus Amulumruptor caecigallinarius]|nr:VWA domain-containing protein [Candidatus Amulumruptor caecigallinarius]